MTVQRIAILFNQSTTQCKYNQTWYLQIWLQYWAATHCVMKALYQCHPVWVHSRYFSTQLWHPGAFKEGCFDTTFRCQHLSDSIVVHLRSSIHTVYIYEVGPCIVLHRLHSHSVHMNCIGYIGTCELHRLHTQYTQSTCELGTCRVGCRR